MKINGAKLAVLHADSVISLIFMSSGSQRPSQVCLVHDTQGDKQSGVHVMIFSTGSISINMWETPRKAQYLQYSVSHCLNLSLNSASCFSPSLAGSIFHPRLLSQYSLANLKLLLHYYSLLFPL